MVGAKRMNSKAFGGNETHGAIQQGLTVDLVVRGRTGRAIVKINHMGGEGVTLEDVYADPDKYLAAYTVMLKREKGYDTENKDWFWAKFDPKGNLDSMMPGGPELAGRVAKTMFDGCIACHVGAGGAGLEVLTPNREWGVGEVYLLCWRQLSQWAPQYWQRILNFSVKKRNYAW